MITGVAPVPGPPSLLTRRYGPREPWRTRVLDAWRRGWIRLRVEVTPTGLACCFIDPTHVRLATLADGQQQFYAWVEAGWLTRLNADVTPGEYALSATGQYAAHRSLLT